MSVKPATDEYIAAIKADIEREGECSCSSDDCADHDCAEVLSLIARIEELKAERDVMMRERDEARDIIIELRVDLYEAQEELEEAMAEVGHLMSVQSFFVSTLPEGKCFTIPDGDCIGNKCMHQKNQ